MDLFEKGVSTINPHDYQFDITPYRDELFENIVNPRSTYMKEILKYFDIKRVLSWSKKERLERLDSQHPQHVKRFDGYTAYYFPDALDPQSNHDLLVSQFSDVSYGIAFATSEGEQHWHEKGHAYNKILQGEGIFLGSNTSYDGESLLPGMEIEIPRNMLHGHKVSSKEPLVFLFVQECGFFKGMGCEGDFHALKEFS